MIRGDEFGREARHELLGYLERSDIFTKRRLYFSEGHVYVHVRTYAQLSLSHAIYFAWALGYTSIRYFSSDTSYKFSSKQRTFDNKITKF